MIAWIPVILSDMAAVEFIGFHGTNKENVESILRDGFNRPARDSRMGPGHYFYIGGCSTCAETDAKRWAQQAAFNKETRKLTHPRFAVLRAKITCSNVFDLRWEDHLKFFNERRDGLHDDLVQTKNALEDIRSKEALMDGAIIAKCQEFFKFDAVVMHCFSNRNYRKKLRHFQSYVPNASILCVCHNEARVAVDISDITEVSSGDIELPEL